jgi:flagellar biosynthesis/type III secretory pathway chaperone
MDSSDQVLLHIKTDLERLRELMELEFELLKSRDLEGLASCDEEKTALLTRLQSQAEYFAQAENLSPDWIQARDELKNCRDLHFRNLQLLRRQLDAVQGALQSLTGHSMPATETYDRQGMIRHAAHMRALLMA